MRNERIACLEHILSEVMTDKMPTCPNTDVNKGVEDVCKIILRTLDLVDLSHYKNRDMAAYSVVYSLSGYDEYRQLARIMEEFTEWACDRYYPGSIIPHNEWEILVSKPVAEGINNDHALHEIHGGLLLHIVKTMFIPRMPARTVEYSIPKELIQRRGLDRWIRENGISLDVQRFHEPFGKLAQIIRFNPDIKGQRYGILEVYSATLALYVNYREYLRKDEIERMGLLMHSKHPYIAACAAVVLLKLSEEGVLSKLHAEDVDPKTVGDRLDRIKTTKQPER
jgi:hypothetical protein